MPIETFSYVDSLVTTNPAGSEGGQQGDDHLRGIKQVLKNTFPSLTGAVTATQATLNNLQAGKATLSGTDGSGLIFSPGAQTIATDAYGRIIPAGAGLQQWAGNGSVATGAIVF